jgi:hypothetical protein
VTPVLFRRAIVSALFVTAIGVVVYLLIKLVTGRPLIPDSSVWLELLPILLISGFLSRLFAEERKAK